MLLDRGAKANDRTAEPQKRRGSRASVFTNLTCGEKMFRIG